MIVVLVQHLSISFFIFGTFLQIYLGRFVNYSYGPGPGASLAGCVTRTGTLTHVLRKKAHPQLGGCAFLLYMKSESSMLVFPTEKHRHSGEAETASPVNGNRESGYAETASKIMLTG